MPTCKVVVSAMDKEAVRLVEAKNEARALAHVTKQHIEISRPTSAELVALGASGVAIELAD